MSDIFLDKPVVVVVNVEQVFDVYIDDVVVSDVFYDVVVIYNVVFRERTFVDVVSVDVQSVDDFVIEDFDEFDLFIGVAVNKMKNNIKFWKC